MDSTVITIILDSQKELRQDLKELDAKLNQILEWKWKLVGGTVVVSGALTVFFQIGLTVFSNAK